MYEVYVISLCWGLGWRLCWPTSPYVRDYVVTISFEHAH